ncbi:MAG: hypothetical protein RMK18_02255 [Armatimonadota bacterium]|nr:hypothetical protein [Armatimonadota bacterium]MCX7777266.1 hypothetical protein [Armatimonadota bacterium]MDW8024680.1 hypothetical protein [Armatimonadota bacterium]
MPFAQSERKRIAWQDISLFVPSEWHIVKLQVARSEGYIRLDDDDMMRFELKWAATPPGQVLNLKEHAQAFLSRMAKEFKKGGKEFTHSIDTKLVGRHQVSGRDVLTFSWVSECIGEGMLWWCGRCGKLVIAQVIGSKGEPIKELAKRVFVSISDHSKDDWHEWELFGLNFKTPASMILREQRVESGFVRFRFKRGDEETLEVARWSAANLILKGTTLEGWAAQVLKEHLRKFDITYRRGKFNGHDCIELGGKAKSPLKTLQLLIRQITKRSPMPKLNGLMWECDKTNRLIMMLAIAPPQAMEELSASVVSFRCH